MYKFVFAPKDLLLKVSSSTLQLLFYHHQIFLTRAFSAPTRVPTQFPNYQVENKCICSFQMSSRTESRFHFHIVHLGIINIIICFFEVSLYCIRTIEIHILREHLNIYFLGDFKSIDFHTYHCRTYKHTIMQLSTLFSKCLILYEVTYSTL